MSAAEHCRFDLHADRNEVDGMLRNGVGYAPILRWLEVRPGTLTLKHKITDNVLRSHRVRCLGLPPIEPGKHSAPIAASGAVSSATAAPLPPADRRSAKYEGRTISEEDVDQELLRTFIDSLDRISPDKVAEYMIEREKSRNRTAGSRAPARGKGDEPPAAADVDAMRSFGSKIGMALGARPTRTGMRAFRAVRGGRA